MTVAEPERASEVGVLAGAALARGQAVQSRAGASSCADGAALGSPQRRRRILVETGPGACGDGGLWSR